MKGTLTNKSSWPNKPHTGPIKIHRDYKMKRILGKMKNVRRYSKSPFRACYK